MHGNLAHARHKVNDPFACITDVDHFVDKLVIRRPRPWTAKQEKVLKRNSRSAQTERSKMDWKWRTEIMLPEDDALAFLTRFEDITMSRLELAKDVRTGRKSEAVGLKNWIQIHMVHKWPGKQHMATYEDTVYWGQRSYQREDGTYRWRCGHVLAMYADRYSKRTGELECGCLHIEDRIQGAAQIRKAGIHSIADLIDFDHAAHWDTQLKLFTIDFERLGRHYLNTWSGQTRSKPRIHESGNFVYNVDYATGCIVWREMATHVDEETGDRFALRTVQRFVSVYGSGPWMVESKMLLRHACLGNASRLRVTLS